MAKVTITIEDGTPNSEGAAIEGMSPIEVTCEADPPIPMVDGMPAVDHEDFTSGMGAALSMLLTVMDAAGATTLVTKEQEPGQ